MSTESKKNIITTENMHQVIPSFILFGHGGSVAKVNIKAYYKELAKGLSKDVLNASSTSNIDPKLMEIVMANPTNVAKLSEVANTIGEVEAEIKKVKSQKEKERLQEKLVDIKAGYMNLALELIASSPDAIQYLIQNKKKVEIEEEIEREAYLESLLDTALDTFFDSVELSGALAAPKARLAILARITEEKENDFYQDEIDFFMSMSGLENPLKTASTTKQANDTVSLTTSIDTTI